MGDVVNMLTITCKIEALSFFMSPIRSLQKCGHNDFIDSIGSLFGDQKNTKKTLRKNVLADKQIDACHYTFYFLCEVSFLTLFYILFYMGGIFFCCVLFRYRSDF